MPGTERIESEIQLLVEGNDQRNFFEALVAHLSLEKIQIRNFGGVNDLGRFLLAFVNMPNFQAVQSMGIVRDAEESARRAFQSVQTSLKKANLPMPKNIEVRTDTNPAVTALVLPGNNRPGMLETLLCESFTGTSVDHCIDEFFLCVEALPDVSIKNQDKARARAYLATKPEPHFSVGVAAKNGYWNLDHDVLGDVCDFMRRIREPVPPSLR